MSLSFSFKSPSFIKKKDSLLLIDAGTFGRVYHCESDKDSVYKQIAMGNDNCSKYGILCEVVHEIAILCWLKACPQIVHLSDVSLDCMTKGQDIVKLYFKKYTTNLFHYMNSASHPIKTVNVAKICFQILLALVYAREGGVLHRDVKPANIFLNNADEVVLGDWGAACVLRYNALPMCNGMQTLWYAAPEALLEVHDHYDEKVDVWSLGCILYQLLTHDTLFCQETHLAQLQIMFLTLGIPTNETWPSITSNQCFKTVINYEKKMTKCVLPLRELIKKLDPLAQHLLSNMLVLNPQKRFSLQECLAHAFFNNVRDQFLISQHIQNNNTNTKQSLTPSSIYTYDCPSEAQRLKIRLWIYDVIVCELKCHIEVFFLAYEYVDLYFTLKAKEFVKNQWKRSMNLDVMACVMLAVKMTSDYNTHYLSSFIKYSGMVCSSYQLMEAEANIVTLLNRELCHKTKYQLFMENLKDDDDDDDTLRTISDQRSKNAIFYLLVCHLDTLSNNHLLFTDMRHFFRMRDNENITSGNVNDEKNLVVNFLQKRNFYAADIRRVHQMLGLCEKRTTTTTNLTSSSSQQQQQEEGDDDTILSSSPLSNNLKCETYIPIKVFLTIQEGMAAAAAAAAVVVV